MILELNGNAYDIATTLGVSYDLEQKHKTKINNVMQKASEYTIEEMCKMMFVGIARKDKTIKFEHFLNDVLDSGHSAISFQKEFNVFIMLLATNDKTEEEIRAEMEKGIQEAETKEEDESKN